MDKQKTMRIFELMHYFEQKRLSKIRFKNFCEFWVSNKGRVKRIKNKRRNA